MHGNKTIVFMCFHFLYYSTRENLSIVDLLRLLLFLAPHNPSFPCSPQSSDPPSRRSTASTSLFLNILSFIAVFIFIFLLLVFDVISSLILGIW